MANFALIGAGGYIAPRHLSAIHATGNKLVAAVDTHDAVGILDRYFPDARFFTEIERFDRFLEKHRRMGESERVNYVSICTPNYLHDAHVRLALRVNAHAICEKPLVINPWNLDALAELEQETGCKVYNILQLRLLPQLIELKNKLANDRSGKRHDVCLSYVTSRGPWYKVSWKGDDEKSGGIATNIGIHFFDFLLWLFGEPQEQELHLSTPWRMAGKIELQRASVRWFLSAQREDLPTSAQLAQKSAFRSITIDGEELEFSDGFTDLHTRVYEDILKGRGFGLEDARPAITLVQKIRTSDVTSPKGNGHPMLNHQGR